MDMTLDLSRVLCLKQTQTQINTELMMINNLATTGSVVGALRNINRSHFFYGLIWLDDRVSLLYHSVLKLAMNRCPAC